MNSRLKFRAWFKCFYNDMSEISEDKNKEINFYLYNVAVYGDGTIGVDRQYLTDAIDKLKLPEYEQESLMEYFEENYSNSDCEEWFNIDCNVTIEQCTGLKDKNGKLIYEGDILKTMLTNGSEIYHIIKWYDGKFVADYGYRYSDKLEDYCCISQSWLVIKEIVGNIQENPELLNA